MARFKHIDTNPRFLAIDLARQLLAGTFEHALHHLLTRTIDLWHFARVRTREAGAARTLKGARLESVMVALRRRGQRERESAYTAAKPAPRRTRKGVRLVFPQVANEVSRTPVRSPTNVSATPDSAGALALSPP